jgi:hypothetical protein
MNCIMPLRHYALGLSLALPLIIISQLSLAQTAVSTPVAASTKPASASAQGPVPEGRGKDRANKIIERFKAADANHDGKLTRAEADGKMPMVFRHFDKIDADKKGYVTLNDIADFIDKDAERRGK